MTENQLPVLPQGKERGSQPVNFPLKKLNEWQSVLSQYAEKHGALYAVSDTETTGTQVVDRQTGLLNRVLEWSMCFCYKDPSGLLQLCLDSSGEPIVVDEPVNPFLNRGNGNIKQRRSMNLIPEDSVDVHGITMEYLFGQSDGAKSRPKLPGPAASFDVVLMTVQSLLSFDAHRKGGVLVNLVFHNASFDIRFLNHECETWEISPIESFFGVIDTLNLAKSVIPKAEIGGYTLNDIYAFGQQHYPHLVETVERPIHSALIDSLILRQVYNIIQFHHTQKMLA